jgi:hypothetical protein
MKKALAILCLAVLAIGLVGCGRTESGHPSSLPAAATNIEDVGNGWVKFTFEDKKFLYHKAWENGGDRSYECLTQLIDNK